MLTLDYKSVNNDEYKLNSFEEKQICKLRRFQQLRNK